MGLLTLGWTSISGTGVPILLVVGGDKGDVAIDDTDVVRGVTFRGRGERFGVGDDTLELTLDVVSGVLTADVENVGEETIAFRVVVLGSPFNGRSVDGLDDIFVKL